MVKTEKIPLKKRNRLQLPLIQPYMKKNEHTIKRWRAKQTTPIKIDKLQLKRVIDEIQDDSKLKIELSKRFGTTGEKAFARCSHPSLEVFSFSVNSILTHNVSTLLHQLRISILNHDWDSCAEMVRILIPSKLINRRMQIYVIRCALAVFLNNCDYTEILEEFLTVSLGLKEETKINEFISSMFTFLKDLRVSKNPTAKKVS